MWITLIHTSDECVKIYLCPRLRIIQWVFFKLSVSLIYSFDLWNVTCFYLRAHGDYLVWLRYVDFGVVIYPGAPNPAYRETLQWRHNERNGVSNHRPRDCLLNRLFRRRSDKTSKLRATGRCEGNSTVTGEFPAQRASNAENVAICWRHHEHA